MRGRTAPARTLEQQKEHERRACLSSLDVAALRAWAERYGVELLGDDQTVLISMHETRATDPRVPARLARESMDWLRGEYPESAVVKRAELTRISLSYGRRNKHA